MPKYRATLEICFDAVDDANAEIQADGFLVETLAAKDLLLGATLTEAKCELEDNPSGTGWCLIHCADGSDSYIQDYVAQRVREQKLLRIKIAIAEARDSGAYEVAEHLSGSGALLDAPEE